MTAPELKRYNLTTEVSPRGAFYGDMTENASGEYVLYSDVQAYTQAAIAALDAYRNNLLDEVIELAKRHAPDFVPFVERMKGNTPC